MSSVRFEKVEAVGNDFVLIEAGAVPADAEPELAVEWCSRHRSIGADGLLVLGSGPAGLYLRMYNADGTADFCGNGLRASMWSAFASGRVGPEAMILHGGREVKAFVREGRVTVGLPPASFDPADIPLASASPVVEHEVAGVLGTAVTTGSAHFVALVAELPGEAEFHSKSHALEAHPLFPERTSVMWAAPAGPDRLRVRIWERGVGETLGCGTGSLAVAAVARRLLGMPSRLAVDNPGGTVEVEDTGTSLLATSTARVVYSGVVEVP